MTLFNENINTINGTAGIISDGVTRRIHSFRWEITHQKVSAKGKIVAIIIRPLNRTSTKCRAHDLRININKYFPEMRKINLKNCITQRGKILSPPKLNVFTVHRII